MSPETSAKKLDVSGPKKVCGGVRGAATDSGPPGQHIHSALLPSAIAFPSPSFFPLLPNQIILFQLLKLFSFVCNGKVIIFRFGFL